MIAFVRTRIVTPTFLMNIVTHPKRYDENRRHFHKGAPPPPPTGLTHDIVLLFHLKRELKNNFLHIAIFLTPASVTNSVINF